ncbi:hypothetical protein KC349_g7108 [Hortaea werneckii]|nr:hypothetical protein KC349_g7108 [Hortaea werneckii]
MLFVLCVVTSAALIAAKLACDAFTSPLSTFPGLFAAKFTDIYRALKTARGDVDSTHPKWHEEYGSAVRIGPNTISFSDLDLIKVIYSTKNAWRKSDMYRRNDVLIDGQRLSNIFNAQDNGWHDQAMKPIRELWSMTKVLEVEPYVDETLNLLSEQERDVNNLIVDSTKGLFYFAPVSQIPWIDHLLDKNPLIRVGPKPTLTGVVYTFGVVAQSQQELREHGAKNSGKERPPHYLDRYVHLKEQKSKEDLGGLEVDDKQIVNWSMLNILAGGDTTSATMRAVVYYLAKTPSNYNKLIAELDTTQLAVPVQWKDTSGLPYIDAVIREAIRYSPGIAMIFEREVPASGMHLPDGRYVPEGTKMGVNPAVTNRNKEMFGSDADGWNADRWLRGHDEAEVEYKARLARMKDVSESTFGGGNRLCIGKPEMYKLFGTLFSLYDIKLADPAHEFIYKNAWFVYQYDMPMVITRRRARNQ